jgi:LPXTG-motif cell wall-anchored protein
MRGRTLARIGLAAGAALIATFGVIGPAYSIEPDTVPLNSGQANKDLGADDFENKCDNVPGETVPAGFDGWVFVLPGSAGPDGGDFVSLTLKFKDAQGEGHNVLINSDGATIDGKTVDGGLIVKANAQDTSKAWVQIPDGWTIVNGSAEATAKHGEFFNVTHVCVGGGGGSTPPSSSSSSSSSGGGGSSGSSGSSSSAGGGGGSLPTTGAKIGVLVGIGLVLVAGGVGLVALRRRRDIVVTPDGS